MGIYGEGHLKIRRGRKYGRNVMTEHPVTNHMRDRCRCYIGLRQLILYLLISQ